MDRTDSPPPDDTLTPTEAAALIGWLMRDGARLSTVDVARRCGYSYSGAWSLLCKVSRTIPIHLDEDTGVWCVVDGHEPG